MEEQIINLKMEEKTSSTNISNKFIDEYLTVSNPTFVLVYIFFYRHCFSGTGVINKEFASSKLNILESDIINAFKYWEKEGLLNINYAEGFSIEFLEVKSKIKATNEQVPKEEVVKKVITLETRPQYAVQELEMIKNQSEEVQKLFSLAEETLSKMLNFNDLSVLFSLYDWLGLPLKVIEILLKYCQENNSRNMRYIEKVAIDWAENGINTIEKAEEHLRVFNKDYREILKAFGQNSRNPTTSEINYMKKWLFEINMPLEIVLEACDKTIMQIGQPKFSYADKILTKWDKENMKTIEKIRESEEAFYKSKEEKVLENKKISKPKSNRFANFEQRNYDFEEMERLVQKKLEDKE
jgi:DnaD/phage-associated family protein